MTTSKEIINRNIKNYGATSSVGDDDPTLPIATDYFTETSSYRSLPHPAPEKHSIIGILLIMLGAFSFSIMFFLVKVMSSTSTFTLVFYRSLVQIAISYLTLRYHGENPLGPEGTRFLLGIRGIFGSAAVCAWFFGIQVLPLPDAVTLQFTTPPFAAAFAVCMVGEAWKLMDMIGAIVCITGVALIAHPTWLFGKAAAVVDTDADETSVFLKALAVLVTTAGAAMAGIAYVCVRKIGDRASAIVMVLYYGVFSIPMVVIGAGLLENNWQVWRDDNFVFRDYFIMFIMGLGGYGGQFFTNLGLQRETAATATLATCTQIVWTYVFELFFLHEAINGWSIGGTSLILGYMLIVAITKMLPRRVETLEEKAPLLDLRGMDIEVAATDDCEMALED